MIPRHYDGTGKRETVCVRSMHQREREMADLSSMVTLSSVLINSRQSTLECFKMISSDLREEQGTAKHCALIGHKPLPAPI